RAYVSGTRKEGGYNAMLPTKELVGQDLQYSYYHYLVFSAILLLPLLVLKLRLRQRKDKDVNNPPPGPWRLPVIGSLHHLVSLAGALPHHVMRDLAGRHGPLMLLRLGELPLVVASSADAAMAVMKTHDAAFATRPQTATLRALTKDGLGVIYAPNSDHWRQLRKLVTTELLSARRVKGLRVTREAEVSSLVASIASSASSRSCKDPVNLSSLLSRFVTDVTTRSVVGDWITEREAYLEAKRQVVKMAAKFSLADLFPSSRLARMCSGGVRQAEACNREINRIMSKVIEDHRARRSAGTGGKEEVILDVLLRTQIDGVPLDMGTIRAVILDLFAAGSESFATTLEWALAELIRNPTTLHKAQSEVRRALAGHTRVSEDALRDLPYLHLVIKETLRLHPTGPLLLPRECREPCRVLGFDVPQGAMVLVNAWAIGRDAASWGADADEFRPERFQGDGGAVEFYGTDYQFLPFGAGRRMCPGVLFALANVELAMASLLYHFDWELPGGADPTKLDMTEGSGLSARRKSELWLNATVQVTVPE
uniref:Cytochrome P450 n=3 Tax=Aegilops tauschii TaxID=37682 RepID=A0A453DZ37_AEGTS